MRASAEPLEGNKVKLSFSVDETEVETEIDKAFKKFAQQVRIPGFRPGKAPRKILETHIGLEAARAQALNDALPDFYAKALRETETDAIDTPEVEITDGKDEGPVTFEAEVEVRPTPNIPGYQGLSVEVPNPIATDEDVEAEINRLRAQYGELEEVDRAAAPGDFVTLDVHGTSDGEPVPGLTATDYSYEVGNRLHSLGEEFDDEVNGSKTGDSKEFTSKVPPNDDEVLFKLAIKAVNERKLPELDDEWVNEASEFETVQQLRDDIAEQLAKARKGEAERQLRNGVIKAVAELVDEEIPEALVDAEVRRQVRDILNRLSQQGIDLAAFLQATGQDEEAFIEQIKLNATDSVRADLALRAVAEKEDLQASDEDIDEELENLARQFKQKASRVRRDLEHADQMPAVRSDIRKGKAVRWLMDHVEIVDSEGNKIDRSAISTAAPEAAEGQQAEVQQEGEEAV